LLGYDSNPRAYHIFNKDSGYVKITRDMVFDETNNSQEEHIDLDLVDDDEASYDALQRMTIGDVKPQDLSKQLQGHAPSDTTPPA
jgi:hypothetical protein